MTTKNDKTMHFGSISMSKAKGLYGNGNYSLLMVLLYLDSRKRKVGEQGYDYPFEYNAPDIHYNTGVGLKAINKHLKMLEMRGALKLMVKEDGSPERTSKGALKYTVVKSVYEQHWGPSSKSTNPTLDADVKSAPKSQLEGQSGTSTDAGQSQPGGECRAIRDVRECPMSDSSRAFSAHRIGHSGTSANIPRPGHSAPTNDNERFREEKSCAKKEDCSASPSLVAPASASQGLGRVKEEKSSQSLKNSISASSPLAPPASADPIDSHYGIPVSYVRRYEKHSTALNKHLTESPEVAAQMAKSSDHEAGRILMQLLDTLKLN